MDYGFLWILIHMDNGFLWILNPYGLGIFMDFKSMWVLDFGIDTKCRYLRGAAPPPDLSTCGLPGLEPVGLCRGAF